MNSKRSEESVLRFEQRDLSSSNWQNFRSKVMGVLANESGDLVLDLRNVKYVFSGVLNVMIEARVRLRTLGSELSLIVDNQEFYELLQKVGFHEIFVIRYGE